MRRLALILVPLLAVAACGHKATEETQTTVTKNGVTTTTITTREVSGGKADNAAATAFSIDADKFKANVEIPGLSFGGDHMDLDGMKLYPGTTVKGMHVHAVDKGTTDSGEVVMDFSSPAVPVTVAQHMADQARAAGFTVTANTAALVAGNKVADGENKRFTMTLNPNGGNTVGTMTLTGSKPRSRDDD